MPASEQLGVASTSFMRAWGFLSISSGIWTSNVLPTPSSLEISMVPPIMSMSDLTMGMPMPVPWNLLRASLLSWANGS